MKDPPDEYREMVLGIMRDQSKPLHPHPSGYDFEWREVPECEAIMLDVYGTLVCSGVGDISLSEDSNEDRDFYRTLGRALEDAEVWTESAQAARFSPSLTYREIILGDHRASRVLGISHPEVNILHVWERLMTEWKGNAPSGKSLPDLELADIIRLAVHYECIVNPVWLYDGVAEFLKNVKATGKPMGIISNSQFYTPLMLQCFLGMTLAEAGIDDTISSWSYREKVGKPNRKLFEAAAERLQNRYQLAPEKVLFIGNDLLKDVYGSRQLGFITGLYTGDDRSLKLHENESLCKGLHPDWIFDDWIHASDSIAGK